MTESNEIVMTVEQRSDQGKGAARKLRREGRIPAVLYGGDKPPLSISVEEHSLRELLKRKGGDHTIFLLKVEGTKDERRAMIREIQKDPISGRFTHIDFIRITAGHKIHVRMPVELKGDCVGVRHGGRIDFISRELQIEVLPRDMFEKFTIDISNLDVGQHLSVADLESMLPPSGRFLEDAHRMVVVVETPRLAPAEAEAAPAGGLVITEAAEPEVIRKGKVATEESE
ncbi:MAG: 50S ribosomal protein L25 [Holophagae bacterium]|nr:MAG: 50S ribosomal protein L25 [Holophagae bacterium]